MPNPSHTRQLPVDNCHRLECAMACSALLLATSLATAQPATVPFAPASTPEQEKLRVVPAKRLPGKVHLLPATMETTQWGWFNNAQPPVLNVYSGDTIVVGASQQYETRCRDCHEPGADAITIAA